MAQHYLVFINGAWHRTNRLPTKKYPPPEPWQVKWLIRGWEQYLICERRLLWRVPHINGQGRRKPWRQVLLIQKHEGYKGVNLWRNGRSVYFSVVALRRLLQLVPLAARNSEAGNVPGSAG